MEGCFFVVFFFNEKNITNLIAFSWGTVSSALLLLWVGRRRCSDPCLLVDRSNSSAPSLGPLCSGSSVGRFGSGGLSLPRPATQFVPR